MHISTVYTPFLNNLNNDQDTLMNAELLVGLNLFDEHKAALITEIEDVFMPTAHTSPGTNTMRECQADLTTESRK